MHISIRPVWKAGCLLGEGPLWMPEEEAIRFVDIKAGNIHRYHPATGETETIRVGGSPSFIAAACDGRWLVGHGNSIRRFDGNALGVAIASLDQPAHNRLNDATVDESGRLWFGTMDDREREATGSFWYLDDSRPVPAGGRAIVTNGPAISRGDRWIYCVDSSERTIRQHALEKGRPLDEGRIFLTLGEEEGYPDGITIDSEDCLWVALWDGWAVHRYAPDGTLLLHLPFPCARVTKVAFGGPDLRTAYVTTARVGLDASALAGQPLAGSLFAFDAPAPGRVLPSVRP